MKDDKGNCIVKDPREGKSVRCIAKIVDSKQYLRYNAAASYIDSFANKVQESRIEYNNTATRHLVHP